MATTAARRAAREQHHEPLRRAADSRQVARCSRLPTPSERCRRLGRQREAAGLRRLTPGRGAARARVAAPGARARAPGDPRAAPARVRGPHPRAPGAPSGRASSRSRRPRARDARAASRAGGRLGAKPSQQPKSARSPVAPRGRDIGEKCVGLAVDLAEEGQAPRVGRRRSRRRASSPKRLVVDDQQPREMHLHRTPERHQRVVGPCVPRRTVHRLQQARSSASRRGSIGAITRRPTAESSALLEHLVPGGLEVRHVVHSWRSFDSS